MIWTRRSFLRLVAVGAAGTLISPALPSTPSALPVSPNLPNSLFGITVTGSDMYGTGSPANVRVFRLGRPDGSVILEYQLNARARFQWWAPLGMEIVGDVVNLSNTDLEICGIHYRSNGYAYAWFPGQGAVPLDASAPPATTFPLIEIA